MTMLNAIELVHAQQHIDNMPKGSAYTLKKIFGASWASIQNKNAYGKKFKQSVSTSQLNNIVFNKIKTNNHNTYSI